jgi:hypothetical protein
VSEHIGGPDGDVEAALRRVQDALACALPLRRARQMLRPDRKYRYMDANLQQRRASLTDKIPDIRKTLAMVDFLLERRVRARRSSTLAWIYSAGLV